MGLEVGPDFVVVVLDLDSLEDREVQLVDTVDMATEPGSLVVHNHQA